jgi:hypothetical protein
MVLFGKKYLYLNVFLKRIVLKRICQILVFCFCSLCISAQQMGTAVATFVDYPVSAHVAALGGLTVSSMGNDPMFAVCNPASLTRASHNMLHLNYSVYMVGTGYGSALYATALSEKDLFAGSFQFATYGEMDGYDEFANPTGAFSAQDFALNATYARVLNKYFTVGVTLKPLLSTYETYTCFSLGADLGIQFTDTTHLVSAGLALRNFGGRVAGPEQIQMVGTWMPINLAIGVSKRFTKAPFCLHLTLQNLQKWNYDVATNTGEMKKISAGEAFARKILLGVDVVPKSDKFWISLAYNFDRGFSLANPYVFSVAGLSAGFGLKVKMVQLGAAVAFYNTAAVTGHFSVALDINECIK